jgi:transcriptional regulator with XRE-family HTH domain
MGESQDQVKKFAERLNQAISDNRITARELAKQSGINETNISRYRRGYAIPARGKIMRLASVLTVSPQWLLGYSDDKNYDLSPEEKARNEIDNLLERMDINQLKDTQEFIEKFIIKK